MFDDHSGSHTRSLGGAIEHNLGHHSRFKAGLGLLAADSNAHRCGGEDRNVAVLRWLLVLRRALLPLVFEAGTLRARARPRGAAGAAFARCEYTGLVLNVLH